MTKTIEAKTEIQGEMSLAISKEVEDVLDAVAKFDELNVQSVEVKVTLMDGSVETINVNDHNIVWQLKEVN